MNLLLIRPEELESDRNFTVTGPRAEHIRTVLRAKTGDSIKTAFFNGKIGKATILSLEKGTVRLHADAFDVPPPSNLPLILAVALPRPQSFKKTLHFAVSTGIQKIIFFQSFRVEKSYWNSTVLQPEALNEEIREGLEQGVDTVPPELLFYRNFRDFLEASHSIFPQESLKLVAHPGPPPDHRDCKNRPIVLTIGPEGGFVKSELDAFLSAGFQSAGFGAHILRVEFAAAFISGYLMGCGKS